MPGWFACCASAGVASNRLAVIVIPNFMLFLLMICPARLGRGCRGRPSKPSADSADQARFLHGLAFGAREAGGVAELPFPRHADIRRELALDLITEAKTQLGVAKA